MAKKKEKEELLIEATDKKYRRAPEFYCVPESPDGNYYFGFEEDEDLSAEEKEKMATALKKAYLQKSKDAESGEVRNADVSIPVKHNDRFDLNTPLGKGLARFLRKQSNVAENKSAIIPAKHRFVIMDLQHEAEIKVSKINIKREAFVKANEIVNAGPEAIKDACRQIGIMTRGFSNIQVEQALLEYADNTPKKFIDIISDPLGKYRIFIAKLIEKGIIKKQKNGSYSYGEDRNVIAINEHQMIVYLQDKANESIVTLWGNELSDNRLEKPKVSKSKNKDEE